MSVNVSSLCTVTFLLKSPLHHHHHHHLTFLSHGLHLLQFSRCDFCFIRKFFDSQSSEYKSLVHLPFLVLLYVPIVHLLTFSLLPHILNPLFPLCVDHNTCFVSPYLSFLFLWTYHHQLFFIFKLFTFTGKTDLSCLPSNI